MNIQKNVLNKKYLMVTALIATMAVVLPNVVNHMFAGNSIKKEAPVVIQLVDEATIEVELIDESEVIEENIDIINESGVTSTDETVIDIVEEDFISDESEIIELDSALDKISESDDINIVIEEELLYSEEVIISGTGSWDEGFEIQNNITIHIGVEDEETKIFGTGDVGKNIEIISDFGFKCTTLISTERRYKCGVGQKMDILKDQIRARYEINDIADMGFTGGDVGDPAMMMDPAMMDPAMMDPAMMNP